MSVSAIHVILFGVYKYLASAYTQMDKGGPYFFLIGVSIPLVFPRYLFIYFSRHTNGIRKKTRLKNYMPLHVTYRRERESLEGVFPKMCWINSPVTFSGWIGSRTSIIATTKRRRRRKNKTKNSLLQSVKDESKSPLLFGVFLYSSVVIYVLLCRCLLIYYFYFSRSCTLDYNSTTHNVC